MERHARLMLFPPAARSTCFGVRSTPQVTVTGTFHGIRVGEESRVCDWPGGTGATVFVAATSRDRALLARSLAQIRCGELFYAVRAPQPASPSWPMFWKRVRACSDSPQKRVPAWLQRATQDVPRIVFGARPLSTVYGLDGSYATVRWTFARAVTCGTCSTPPAGHLPVAVSARARFDPRTHRAVDFSTCGRRSLCP